MFDAFCSKLGVLFWFGWKACEVIDRDLHSAGLQDRIFFKGVMGRDVFLLWLGITKICRQINMRNRNWSLGLLDGKILTR